MKSAICYYSYTGNTEKVAVVLGEFLSLKGVVELVRIKAKKETNNFFIQAWQARIHKRVDIENIKFDFQDYELFCLGTPVWAFGPAPAVNTFLDKIVGLEDKIAILFTTYGSGTGNKHCLAYMKKILLDKGTKEVRLFTVASCKSQDKDFILSQIKRLWPNG